jgi:hypothetical protein
MSKHDHWCKPCGKKVLKWGVILWVLHLGLHVVAWCVSPALGAALLVLL